MKLSFRGAVYESPFPSADIYSISDLPSYEDWLARQMDQIPGLQIPQSPYTDSLRSQAIAVPLLIAPIASILVAVWEPATLCESRIRPFHFAAKYLLSSQQAVFDLLRQYYLNHLDEPHQPAPCFFIGVRNSLVRRSTSLWCRSELIS